MAKILLVEDDNNLREIYEARLQAEGYTIVSAHDGEEALVVAKAERPDLIISDVMMPKISGFEMLDILRNTDSLRGVKVIMLTALGQSDDQQRASKLGADRYLVKSQVTLEDIVNEANSLLQPAARPADATMPTSSSASSSQPPQDIQAPSAPSTPEPTASAPLSAVQDATIGAVATAPPSEPASTPTTTTIPVTTPEPEVSEPTKDDSTSVDSPAPTSSTDSPQVPTVDPGLAESESAEESEVKSQIEDFAKTGTTTEPTPSPTATDSPKPTDEPFLTPEDKKEDASAGYSPQPTGKKVIQPLPDSQSAPDINELLEKEKAKELMESAKQQDPEAPPTLSVADTAPAPSTPIISPSTPSNPDDPNNIAL